MAIFTPGVAVAAVSGSVGGTVFSRNRGGAYMRVRAVPVSSQSEKALLFKSYLALASQYWRGMNADLRKSWSVYAQSNPVTNRLGQSKSLTGQNHFIRINTRMLAAGQSFITEPPVDAPPSGIVVSAFAVAAGLGTATLTFTETPIGTDEMLWIRGAKVNSAAINNVENLLTTVVITPVSAASPLSLEDDLEEAFGPLQEGAQYVLEVRVLGVDTGLVSGRIFARTVGLA
jgi:hypothetical protein